MMIGAHPDDIEYFAGGTLAQIQRLNINVTVSNLVVTNGNAGGIAIKSLIGGCERDYIVSIRCAPFYSVISCTAKSTTKAKYMYQSNHVQ